MSEKNVDVMPDEREVFGEEITTDWYDGPLRTIRRVTFPAEASSDPLVQIWTRLADVYPTEPGKSALGEAVIRLSRDELVCMIDLLDGKPVKGLE